jgi:exosortase A
MNVLWQNKIALAHLSLLIVGWFGLFWPSLVQMEAVWRGSDTYTHAYAVPFIIAWLLATSPQRLQGKPTADWRLSLLLLPVLLLWMVGYAADIAAVGQLSAVLALQAILISWLGLPLAKQLKFPIFYLIFLLPFGEELHPLLQNITADLTMIFLHLTSIPAFREGLYITTPVGNFEVAVACSGLRFLIASLAIGTLFAHLSFISIYRQVLFMVVLVIVSIIANGIRAFFLIFIAEKSNMAYGFGADHYVYGWVVFGLVLLLMFYLGGKFSDMPAQKADQEEQVEQEGQAALCTTAPATASPVSTVTPSQPWSKQCGLVLVFFAVFFGWSRSLPLLVPPTEPPAALASGDQAQQQSIWSQSIALNHQPESTPQQSFAQGPTSNWGIYFPHSLRSSLLRLPNGAEVYRAEFGHRQQQGELVNWSNQLFNGKQWTIVSQQTIRLAEQPARLLELSSLQGQRRLVLFWYQVAERRDVLTLPIKLAQLQALMTADTRPAQINAVSMLTTNALNDQAQLLTIAEQLLQQDPLP